MSEILTEEQFLQRHNLDYKKLKKMYTVSYYGEVTTHRKKADVQDDVPEIVNMFDDGTIEVIHNDRSELFVDGFIH